MQIGHVLGKWSNWCVQGDLSMTEGNVYLVVDHNNVSRYFQYWELSILLDCECFLLHLTVTAALSGTVYPFFWVEVYLND